MSLTRLLVRCVELRANGTLFFSEPAHGSKRERSIVLVVQDGRLAKIKTSEPAAPLGNVLVELGYLRPSELDDALGQSKKEGLLLGQSLLKRKRIGEGELRHALRHQLGRKVITAFSFSEATSMGFFDGQDLLGTGGALETLSVHPYSVLWSGIRQHPPVEEIRQALQQVAGKAIRYASGYDLSPFEFEDKLQSSLHLLRVRPLSPREFHELVALSAAVADALLFCLLATRTVSPVLPKTPDKDILLSSSRSSGTPPRAGSSPSIPPPPGRGSIPPAPLVPVNVPSWGEVRAASPAETPGKEGKSEFPSLPPAAPSVPPVGAEPLSAMAGLSHGSPKRTEGTKGLRDSIPPKASGVIPTALTADELHRQAEFVLDVEDWAMVESLCQRALKLEPQKTESMALLAWARAHRIEASEDDLRKCIADLDVAVEANPRQAKLFAYRGMVYARLGNPRLALRDLQRASELNPSDASVLEPLRHAAAAVRSQASALPPPGMRSSSVRPPSLRPSGPPPSSKSQDFGPASVPGREGPFPKLLRKLLKIAGRK